MITSKRSHLNGLLAVGLITLVGFALPTAHAGTYTWANAGTNWTTASNWGGTVPGTLDIAQFNSSVYTFQPVLSTSVSAGAVWESGNGSLGIQGGTLGLFGVTVNGTPNVGLEMDANGGGLTIASAISLGNSQTWTNNSPISVNILGNVATNAGRALTITGSGNTLISGVITGAGLLLTKTGSGSLLLTGSNTYTGNTAINGGTLQIGNGAALGSLNPGSPISIGSGGTLFYSETNSQTIGNNISGAGTWILSGSPSTVFTLTGLNSGFTGALNINGGRVSISGSSTLLPSSSATISIASGAEFILNIGTCGSNLSISGSGPGPSAGALVFQGSPLYSGSIALTGNAQISSSGAAVISGNISGPYQLTLFAQASAFSLLLSGSNTYGSTLLSSSTTVVTVGGANAISSGPLSFSGASTLKTTGFSFGVSSLSGSAGQIQNGSATTGSTLTVGSDNSNTSFGGTLVDGGTASLALTKTGTGSLALGGANTFSGPTDISAGTLQLVNAGALQNSSVKISAGVLGVSGVIAAIPSLSGGGGVALSVGTLSVGGNSLDATYAGAISGSGGFVKQGAGSLMITGSSNFAGTTALTSGLLLLGNTAGSALGTSTLTINGGELASTAGSGGAIGGSLVAGNGGHVISPGGDGSIGSLGVGGLTINSLSTLRFDISSPSSLDQINDAGSLGYSGTGAASLLVSNSLTFGLYKLMSYSSTSSISASNFSVGLIGGGTVPLTYELLLKPNELDLEVGNITNNSVLAASTSAVAFGRIMLNHVPTSNVAISLSSGTSQTGFSVSASGGATAIASGNGPGAIPPTGNVAISLSNTAGSYNGTVAVQNSGDDGSGPGSAGSGLGAAQSPIAIGISGTVVDNRIVTSSSAAFSLIRLGQSVSQSIILSTTGSDSQFTRVTVPNGSDANGFVVSGGSNLIFNSPTVSDSRTLSGTPNSAGILSGAVVLATSGEGLSGESPVNVSVGYTISIYSGSARWNGGSSSSWGAGTNWTDQLTPSIHAAPGTFTGFSDAMTLDNSSSNRSVNLDGTSPRLFSMTLATTSGNGYTVASGSGGTLVLDNGAGTATVSVVSGTHAITAPITLASASSIATNGGTLLLNTTISGTGTLIKAGSGLLTLPGADTLGNSGGLVVSQGTLAAPLGIPHAGGAVTLAGSATLAAAGQIKRAVSGAGTLTATGDLFVGSSGQSGQFNQGGTPGIGGTLNVGSNAVILLSSDKAVLGSQTTIGDGGSLTTLNGAQLGNAASLEATKVLTASGNATINGNFVNNGVVNGPTGTGQELTFTQFVKGAGSTTGNVQYEGTYSPGNSPYAVSVDNVTLSPTSTLILEIGGTTAGAQYDQLDISGLVTLDGTLDLELLNGFTPAPGDTFEFFNGATTGDFTQVILPALGNGFIWDTSALYSGGAITVVPEPATLALAAAGLLCLAGFALLRGVKRLLTRP